jgi:recombination protein RecT
MSTSKAVANVATENNPSERFTMAVIKEFPTGLSKEPIQLTIFQRKLIQNYFIKIDSVLKDAEVKRLAKSEQYRDALEFSWQNVNMHKLALDVVAYSSIGLDPLQNNHIHPIPYKNNKTNKYDIVLMEGYNGLELKARKYGYDVPDEVIFELKYSGDRFKSQKKGLNVPVESYTFEIGDDFNRGDLEGGFYYMIFRDNPEKNKLVVLSRKQIEKRKPAYASAEFWGGEKDKWENGKKSGKEQVEGWEEEMFMKTLKRHCWNSINIDSQKIDDHLVRILESEAQAHDRAVEVEISENANKKELQMNVTEDRKLEPKSQAEAFEVPESEKQITSQMPGF